MNDLPAPLETLRVTLADWWDDWVNQTFLCIIWIFAWFTVVLGPPATLGLYVVAHGTAYGRGRGPVGMIEGARRYFFTAWRWALVNAAVAAIAYANLWFYAGFEAAWSEMLRGAFVVLGILWILIQFYALPYLVEQKCPSVRQALRNGTFSVLAFPGYTLVVGAAALAVAGASVAFVAPLILGGPALVALLGARAVRERLETCAIR